MMRKWQFHQYPGYKKPFVWHIAGATPNGRPIYEFVHSTATRRSHSGKFGDYEFAIAQPGLYKVGNTKDENGYRFVFMRDGIWRFRSLYDEAEAIRIARELQAGVATEDLTQELIEKFGWHFPYRAHENAAHFTQSRHRSNRAGGKI
jgi:hypothetical protein